MAMSVMFHWLKCCSTSVMVVAIVFALAHAAWPDETEMNQDEQAVTPRVRLPTLGGMQWWTDYFVEHDYRIQRYVVTGHYRLLDGTNGSLVSGTYAKCREVYERLKREHDLRDVSGRVVVTLHGLGRTRESMSGIGTYLVERGDFTWLNVQYASTRERVGVHARALQHVLSELRHAKEVNFVAHSMGNLVVRHYLHDVQALRQQGKEVWQPPLGRIVMLAPPNSGTAMASMLKDNGLFRLIAGSSGRQLAEDWAELEDSLATPTCPFGIIAGGRGNSSGYSPLLAGDDDLVVSVRETRLAGAGDFRVVPAVHTYIMDHEQTQRLTLQFLRHGYFETPQSRQPIDL